MNEAARQNFWNFSNGSNELPYIYFNVNGTRNNSSKYFKTEYVPNANSTIEMLFLNMSAEEFGNSTGHQHGTRSGWVSNAMQLNLGYASNSAVWPAYNSNSS